MLLPLPQLSSWKGFHSISFPSEWGLCKVFLPSLPLQVSIQLVSPASGDKISYVSLRWLPMSFHSISFPSEWGLVVVKDLFIKIIVFPFN